MPDTAGLAQSWRDRGLPTARSFHGRSPTFWFIVGVVLIAIFGGILALVISLASKTTHTSNPPDKHPHHSALGRPSPGWVLPANGPGPRQRGREEVW